MPPQYQNAKIYKLVSNTTADVYIGSCLVDLCKRLGVHKAPTNACVSKRMFVDDAIITIVLIEALPECKSKAEMKARELFHITNNACININKPFVTETVYGAEWMSEYYKAHIEQSKEYYKKYYTANAEQIKKYNKANAEQIKEYQKEYNKANVEHKKAYDKEYRAKKKAQKLITETLVV
tara:strand:- start:142 stop:681 length:540 start_codon:yes stop_codon:yes gene_type:complete